MRAPIQQLNCYLKELWNYRHFWVALVRLDVWTRYRGSFLGIGWSLLKPIAMTIVICMVFGTIFQVNIREFAPYLLVGFAFWAFVSESMLGGCIAFHQAEGYIRQAKLPLAIFPLRVVLGAGFHFIVSLPIVLVFLAFTKGLPSIAILPPLCIAFATMLLLGWALAALGGLVQVFFPDMKHILEILLQITFYLTPIMYPADLLRSRLGESVLLNLNPFAVILDQLRQPILLGGFGTAGSYGFAFLFVAMLTALAVALLYRLERRLVFWL